MKLINFISYFNWSSKSFFNRPFSNAYSIKKSHIWNSCFFRPSLKILRFAIKVNGFSIMKFDFLKKMYGQNLVNWPFCFYSVINNFSRYTNFFRPFGYSLFFSVKFNNYITSTVQALLVIWYPATIIRSVISVHITTLDGMSRWSRTHVIDKIFKTILPSLANRNTSTSVSIEGNVFWIGTSLFHCHPCSVSRTIGVIMSMARFSWVDTSTRLSRIFLSQRMSPDSNYNSTITSTGPNGTMFVRFCRGNNQQLSNFLSYHIFRGSHELSMCGAL